MSNSNKKSLRKAIIVLGIFTLVMCSMLVSGTAVVIDIVINEVMYDPSDESKGEFVELYNPTSAPVDVSGWKLSDDGSDVDDLAGFDGGPTTIPVGGYAVITDEDTNVSVPASAIHLTTGDGSICSYGLKNTGETLKLNDSSGNLVDQVDYTSPPMPSCANGYSLERINPLGSSNDPDNWGESEVDGGTPGEENSICPSPVPEFLVGGIPLAMSLLSFFVIRKRKKL